MRKFAAAAVAVVCVAATTPAQTLQTLGAIRGKTEVLFTAVSPDGKHLAGACSDGNLRIWTLPSGEVAHTLDAGGARTTALTYSHNGRRLAAGSTAGTVRVFDADSGAVVQEFSAGPLPIDALALSPEGNLLAVGARDLPTELWNVAEHKQLASLKTPFGRSIALAFSPDSKYLASADGDTAVRIYDAATGKLHSSFDGLFLESFAVDFTPDSKMLLIGGADKQAVVLDPATGRELRRLAKQPDPIGALTVLGDGRTVIIAFFSANSASEARPTAAWNMETGQLKKLTSETLFNGGGVVADGRLIITSSEGNTLKLWAVRWDD